MRQALDEGRRSWNWGRLAGSRSTGASVLAPFPLHRLTLNKSLALLAITDSPGPGGKAIRRSWVFMEESGLCVQGAVSL